MSTIQGGAGGFGFSGMLGGGVLLAWVFGGLLV